MTRSKIYIRGFTPVERRAAKRGFTLIELSIVLVIIGLITGGILLGRDLIAAATVRAQIGQIEKYSTAVNTFRSKYGSLPGDMAPAKASAFGFFALTGALAGTTGYGDENGLIYGPNGPGIEKGEALVFWRHLAESNLIAGSFGVYGNSAIVAGTGQLTADVTDMKLSLPPSKYNGSFLIAYACPAACGGSSNVLPSTNTIELNSPTTLWAATGVVDFNKKAGISPISAFAIDQKMDDGKPNTGHVVAGAHDDLVDELSTTEWNPVSTSGKCLMGSNDATNTDVIYNVPPSTGGDVPACALRFSMQ